MAVRVLFEVTLPVKVPLVKLSAAEWEAIGWGYLGIAEDEAELLKKVCEVRVTVEDMR